MAIPTIVEINYVCFHPSKVNLGHLPLGRRYVEAARLETLPCPTCMAKKRDKARKKMAYQKALTYAQEHRLPALIGHHEDVETATVIRHQQLSNLQYIYEESGILSPAQFDELYLGAARYITSAQWWILYRSMEPAEALECMNTAVYKVKKPNEPPF